MNDIVIQEGCGYTGIGKTARRRMIKRWRQEGAGLSLKEWARRQHPVGDAAYAWVQAKRGSRKHSPR